MSGHCRDVIIFRQHMNQFQFARQTVSLHRIVYPGDFPFQLQTMDCERLHFAKHQQLPNVYDDGQQMIFLYFRRALAEISNDGFFAFYVDTVALIQLHRIEQTVEIAGLMETTHRRKIIGDSQMPFACRLPNPLFLFRWQPFEQLAQIPRKNVMQMVDLASGVITEKSILRHQPFQQGRRIMVRPHELRLRQGKIIKSANMHQKLPEFAG